MAVWDSAERTTGWRPSRRWLADAVGLLDRRLRRQQQVFEYTRHPACVFRLDINQAVKALILRDGTPVRPGQRVARLHFWNEQVPLIPKSGATIAWARQLQRAIATSLHELASFLASRPDLADLDVVCGEVPSGTSAQAGQVARIMERYGFEAITRPEPLSAGEHLHRLGENILISMILLAHNPGAVHLDTLKRARVPIYMTRAVLEKKFG
jgi:hypothetical protein